MLQELKQLWMDNSVFRYAAILLLIGILVLVFSEPDQAQSTDQPAATSAAQSVGGQHQPAAGSGPASGSTTIPQLPAASNDPVDIARDMGHVGLEIVSEGIKGAREIISP